MDVPNIPWREKMERGSTQDRRILANLRRDKCIRPDVSKEFFNRVAGRGNPGSPQDARNASIDTVKVDPDRFVCQGEKIPDGSFSTVFRLEGVKKLGKHLPDEHLRTFGIRDRKTLSADGLSDDELRVIVDMYRGPLKLGSAIDIVWITDHEDSGEIGLKGLVDRLGLAHLEDEERCLRIVYRRDGTIKDLHLPRSFDGIDNGQFDVVENCNADAGKTLPLHLPREQGLSEAVHRACEVVPEQFAVEAIE